jgi:hypothetical protein
VEAFELLLLLASCLLLRVGHRLRASLMGIEGETRVSVIKSSSLTLWLGHTAKSYQEMLWISSYDQTLMTVVDEAVECAMLSGVESQVLSQNVGNSVYGSFLLADDRTKVDSPAVDLFEG